MVDDIERMAQQDVQKIRQYQGGDVEATIPNLVELVLGGLTALHAVVWFGAILLVPDTIDGTTWMGLGLLGLVLFGGPAGLIYWLRRGGAETIRAVVQNMTG